MGMTPTVAIVGRPNVGKSTLFNRLIGERRAIVHDLPGVTRDRITGPCQVDDEKSLILIDTGGLVPGDDPLGLNKQVLQAVEESDLLLLVVDGKSGLAVADERVCHELRSTGKPIVLVVNKGDTTAAKESQYDFYSLGIDRQVLVSAEHNLGLGELRGAMADLVPDFEVPEVPDVPRLAIVGRPNVGKSSLLNRLVGKERVLVSDQPGTTRDPIDTVLELEDGRRYVLVDTAGIRRRGRTADAPEELAVMMARRQIERSDLAIVVVDASQGITSGDLAISGTAWELGKASVIVINKWDLLDEDKRSDLEEGWQRLDEVLAGPPRINISALTGRGVDKIFPEVEQTLERFNTQRGTSELNRIFEGLLRRHRPPAIEGQPWNLMYVTQVKTAPPTFMLFANRQLPHRATYRRYLVNGLRRELGLEGIPIRLVIRKR